MSAAAEVADTTFYGIDVGRLEAGSATTDRMIEMFELMKPRPSTTRLIRVGGDQDGAYLVPDDLEGVVACFSPGVNRIKHFEDELLERFDIDAHMCDFTCTADQLKTPLVGGRQTFLKKWLDVEPSDDAISLDDWVGGLDRDGDLLLQMDIEGAEFRNVLGTSDETLRRFRVIVVEIHGLGKMRDQAVLEGVLMPFFEKLSGSFTCVHAHPNNCCSEFRVPGADINVPNVIELTLLRNDRFEPSGDAPELPHPLDISRNVPSKPPLFLSDAWCDHDRPLPSRVRILEERDAFRDEMAAAAPPEPTLAPAPTAPPTARRFATLRNLPVLRTERVRSVARRVRSTLDRP